MHTATEGQSTTSPAIRDSQAEPKSETINRIAGSVHEAVDRVAQGAHGALQTLRGSSEGWKETGDRSVDRVQTYIRENPITALGVAAAAGFLLSRLLR